MGLEVAPNRPLARLVVNAVAVRGLFPQHFPRGSYAPPSSGDHGPHFGALPAFEVARQSVEEQCGRALRSVLFGERLGELAGQLHPDVVLWSPTLYARSRDAAIRALQTAGPGGDTLTDVLLAVTHFDFVKPRAYLEWRLTGRFSNPCFVDDDLLIEPTGRLVETAGVMVVTLADGLATEVCCYYDDLALLEQLLATG